jgi:hypothetical protein
MFERIPFLSPSSDISGSEVEIRGAVGIRRLPASPSITIETDGCRKRVEALKSRGAEFAWDMCGSQRV